MADELSKLPSPPYMSFGLLKSTIDTLAETTVPTGPLDRHVLDGISGADYGSLMSGLRFLGLVDEQRRATAEFRELIQQSKHPKEFKEHLLALILLKYANITGDLDLEGGTLAQVEKAFRDAGVQSGQMLTKSIRFWIKALTEAGVNVSAYIRKPKPRAPRTTQKKIEDLVHQQHPHFQEEEISVPKGFERMPVPGVPNAFIQYPMDLTEAQCALLDAVTVMLRTYAKTRAGGKEKHP